MAYNKQSTAIEIRKILQNQFSDIMKAIPKAILFFKSQIYDKQHGNNRNGL